MGWDTIITHQIGAPTPISFTKIGTIVGLVDGTSPTGTPVQHAPIQSQAMFSTQPETTLTMDP